MLKNSSRQKALILLAISVLLGFVGYALIFPEKLNFNFLQNCLKSPWGEVRCLDIYGASIGQPLYYSMKYISISFFVLVMTPQTYDSWRKFGYWALPAAFVLVAITPVYGEDFGPLPPRDMMAAFLAKWYMIISVIIIGYSWLKSRREDANRKQVTE